MFVFETPPPSKFLTCLTTKNEQTFYDFGMVCNVLDENCCRFNCKTCTKKNRELTNKLVNTLPSVKHRKQTNKKTYCT